MPETIAHLLAQELGQRAKRSMEPYRLEAVLPQVLELYRSVLPIPAEETASV